MEELEKQKEKLEIIVPSNLLQFSVDGWEQQCANINININTDTDSNTNDTDT